MAKAALSALYALTGDILPDALLKLFNMEFTSDIYLPKILCPVMMLHAEDDDKIPIELAKKLYESARADGKKNKEYTTFRSIVLVLTLFTVCLLYLAIS